MVNILSSFHRYYTTKYSKFKNDLKGHLKKHGELRGPSSISAEHWSKFVKYCNNPYVQTIKYLMESCSNDCFYNKITKIPPISLSLSLSLSPPNNLLTREIPQELENLKLNEFNLSNNKLQGKVPYD